VPAPEGFEGAVGPLIPRARTLANRVLGDPALAEDAAQEALLRAYRFWGARHGAAVWPWLRRTVIRECLRLAERRGAAEGDAAVDLPDPTAPSPEERVLLAEERREVRRALDRLPPGYRAVLELRHARGLQETEIATVLGLPLGTVKWRCKRAHDHIRQVLTRGSAPPLAATLREVAIRLEIRVKVGESVPESPVLEEWAVTRSESTLAALEHAFPRFRLPAAMAAAHPDLRAFLLVRTPESIAPGAVEGAELCTAEEPPRLLLEYGPHRPDPEGRPSGRVTHNFPGNRTLHLDIDTHVGPHPAHWAQVDGMRHIWWSDGAGDGYHIAGTLPAAEMRRIAEAWVAGA